MTLRVLIVDDDEGDRKQIRRSLKQSGLGCEITEVSSLEEALTACDTHDFGCAIMDYQMPGQDGLEGVPALRKRLPYAAIIMVTGQGDEMVASKAIRLGASDYTPKQYITAELIRHTIERALEKMALQRQVDQQREELESFAYVLVHDLKAPLRAVRGFTAFVEEGLRDGGKIEQTLEDCQRVVRAAEHMDALIDALHAYTQVSKDAAMQAIDMQRVFEDTLRNLYAVIEEGGAQVTHDSLPEVVGCAPQLAQLLQNLIGNSIKYCEKDMPTVHVSSTPHEEGGWQFSVKDNGIGIPEKFYHTVFSPFRRLHGPDDYSGSGLGLATCKKIVDRHGGEIWCESVDGEGSTFFFTLQKTEPAAMALAGSAAR